MKTVHVPLAWIATIVVACFPACTTTRPSALASGTSAPRDVDPVEDNAPVANQLEPVLVVSLTIDGNTVALDEAHLTHLPRQSWTKGQADFIRVIGMRAGQDIGRIAVPDPAINILEHGGIVRIDRRTVVAALPVTTPLDQIRVELPGTADAAPSLFDVRPAFERYCRETNGAKPCVQ